MAANTKVKSRYPRCGIRNQDVAGDEGHPKEMLPLVDKPLIQYVE